MVITPVVPVVPPEFGDAPSPRVLPFRQGAGFLDMLKAATGAAPGTGGKPAGHRVQAGESLWRICEAELKSAGGVPSKSDINAAVRRVAAANRLKDADVLAVGQQLDVSSARSGASSPLSHMQNGAVLRDRSVRTELPAPLRADPGVALKPSPRDASTPMAALVGPPSAAMGGAAPAAARPIFHRLSNARPALRAHLQDTRPMLDAGVDAPKAVDLTALMQSILEPGAAAPDTAVAAGPWSKLLAGAGRFTSGFGLRSDPFSGKPQFHDGIDIAAASGTEIYPYMAGTVKSAGWDAGRGNVVVVEHPNGMETVYAHASEMLVKAGDIVMKDTPIAKVGSTGRSTGPHLHFEVRQNSKAINPLPLMTPSLDVAKAL